MDSTGVLFVIDSFELGGTETFATRAIEAMKAMGTRVHVACLRAGGPLLDRVRRSADSFHIVEATDGPFRIFELTLALRHLIRELGPACVYAQDVYSNYLSAGAMLGLSGIRLVTSRRWARTPSAARRILANLAARCADAVVVNANSLVDVVAAEGVNRDRIWVVPNIVELEMFNGVTEEVSCRWRNSLKIPQNAVVLMVAGRLHHDKGQDIALEAMAKLAEVSSALPFLVFMGEGSIRPLLGAKCRELGLEAHVRFGGQYRTPPNVFAYCDIALLPSRTEGMPNALIEAAAAGKRCVAADVGGVRQLAELLGETVSVVQPSDVAEIASAVERTMMAFQGDPSPRIASQELIRTNHSPEGVSRLLERILFRS